MTMETEECEDSVKKRSSSQKLFQANIKQNRIFYSKEFRKKLHGENKLTALTEFLNTLKGETKHDYIIEYLENGGNCLELLQILEIDSTVPPVIVFEIVTHILLKVIEKYHNFQNSSYEACRYLLNNYIMVINKMIGMSSTTLERKVCLKLLTVIVTFSPNLAKDVLLNVNIRSTNLELLTKHTGEKDSVRDHFIHFLTAFLIDGHYPALSVLLEKKGFLTSIISGLKFDSADTLCIVITAMKNHILENNLVSKTAKMKTFNTIVIRDIVNLYNWKGPQAVITSKKNKGNVAVSVNEIEKTKVNGCVHDFLLTLCTSPKYGVIFKDPLVGVGKKIQNPLIYTVLESLDRPWDHSYASDLVIKICSSCPDLTKTLWNSLKSYLEPRSTEKWLKTMKFSKDLIRELQPNCIEYCIRDINYIQLFQIVQMLVAPVPILKIVIPENQKFINISVKHQILLLISEMLSSLKLYLEQSKNWLPMEDYHKFKFLLSNYISKHFPNSSCLLKDWNIDRTPEPEFSTLEYTDNIFNIFEKYKNVSPTLLEGLNFDNINLKKILSNIEALGNADKVAQIQVKCLNIFIDLDFSKFTPNTELFAYIMPLLLKLYYENKDLPTKNVLKKLLTNSGIFDGCAYEIDIWINAILNLKQFNEHLASVIINIFQLTYTNLPQFLEDLCQIATNDGKYLPYSDIILYLEGMKPSSVNNIVLRHRNVSPMILGLAKYLKESESIKDIKAYINFALFILLHSQTQIDLILTILGKYDDFPTGFQSYVLNWQSCQETSFPKSKGLLAVLQNFSDTLFSDEMTTFLENVVLNHYLELPLNLIDFGIFCITNLLNADLLTKKIVNNFEIFVNFLNAKKRINEDIIERLFGNPIILQQVNFLVLEKEQSKGLITRFLINLVQKFNKSNFSIDKYLKLYKEKLLTDTLKFLKRPNKYEANDFLNIFETFELNYEECQRLLDALSKLFENYDEFSDIVFDILTYSLDQLVLFSQGDLSLKPLSKDVIQSLTIYHTKLCKNNKTYVSKLSTVFHKYLLIYPHLIKYVDDELVVSLMLMTDNSKDNISLFTLLLSQKKKYIQHIRSNLEVICNKRALILPALTVLVNENIDENLLSDIYEGICGNLLKALEKPQKAGQYYHKSFQQLCELITKYMPLETCKTFTEKIHKYEVSEIFHVKMLTTIFLKVLNQESFNSKQANNIILTLIHIQINVLKKSLTNDNIIKISSIIQNFIEILQEIKKYDSKIDLTNICNNESFNLYTKLSLKHGVSGNAVLLKSLKHLLNAVFSNFPKEKGYLILEMLLSHSEFLPSVLAEHSDVKFEIWSLFLVLCEQWVDFMERNHVPILLASYRAMVNDCDKVILNLLKMYEKNAQQTKFYDFKPFLWGKAAASHYSIKVNMSTVLIRQPKTGDVLDILQEDLVKCTIKNYPLKESLNSNNKSIQEVAKCYDLTFMLPLFSQLLAPEQQIATYKFSRSGALSLSVVALSSLDKQISKAACHVLARFHSQVEARHSGKDNLLWIRYVEAVCKGTFCLPDYKLNNFAAIYLARMALVLTQPNHIMYLPLSNHLLAKASLDFNTIPELYTFLHSSDINFKEQRNFILELLKDGLRTDRDFIDFMRSMAYKLFSELYSSSVSDFSTKLLILEVLDAATKLPVAVKMLTENLSLLSQLSIDVNNILHEYERDNLNCSLIDKVISILLSIIKIVEDKNTCFITFSVLKVIFLHEIFNSLSSETKKKLFHCIYTIFCRYPGFFPVNILECFLERTNDSLCKYWYMYGCQFVDIKSVEMSNEHYHFRLLINDYKNVQLGS